jgi:hypothetical protein
MTRLALLAGMVTTATNGARLTVKGRWAMAPDVTVAETDGGVTVHIYQTGYCNGLGNGVWASAEHERAFTEGYAAIRAGTEGGE